MARPKNKRRGAKSPDARQGTGAVSAVAASSPGAAAAVAAGERRSQPSSPWILDRWRDLLLFVLTPALILPLFNLARQQWTVQEIYLFVAAFGALGHHLPGMLRAYGDRGLFHRFRTRFIAAPLFLGAVCALFAVRDMGGMVLIASLWGIWHGMAQTYGFVRIYDAKRGSFGKLTARLDRAMCVVWFVGGILSSPARVDDLLDRFYRQIGTPLLPAGFVPTLRSLWLVLLIAVTVAFLVHTVRLWFRGDAVSPIKLVLMATSFGFWWFSCVLVDSMLVGVALFEIFHDVQYLSIVWIYNRNRASQSGGLGYFMSFLFRRSGALIGLYIGLVFAYGSLAFVSKGLPAEPLKGAVQGLLVASALLHFYYDGFIWRVREKSTRESLGLAGGGGEAPNRGLLPAWGPHALYWAPFLVFVGWLGVTEASVGSLGRTALDSAEALVRDVPDSGAAHHRLGKALYDIGRIDEAGQSYRRALDLDSGLALAHYDLSELLRETDGSTEKQFAHLEEALRLDPEIAAVHNDLAVLQAESGEYEKELFHLREALRIEPEYPEAHNNLGVALASRGDLDAAMPHFREVLRLDPDDAGANNNLALALAATGRLEEAIRYFEAALAADPRLREAREGLRSARAGLRRGAETGGRPSSRE